MAYLHCHSCDWSQDDFWSRRYNPLTKAWRDIKWLWMPRFITFDMWLINDLQKYTRVPLIKINRNHIFSWNWWLLEIVKEWKLFREQKWWTWESWEKENKDKAICPNCGKKDFDMD